MHEHLIRLQPQGIPLLANLAKLRASEISEIAVVAERFQGVPNDYLCYLSEIGCGNWLDEARLAPY